VVYNWTLGLVTREQNTKLITLIVKLVLLDRDWGGQNRPLQTKIFSHQCGGRLQPVGGIKPPNLPDKSNTGYDRTTWTINTSDHATFNFFNLCPSNILVTL